MDLKNRNTILNKELNVKNETNLTFEFDKYTSQVTLVFTYSEKNPVSVSLTPPGGKTDSSKISVDKTSKYAIFTLNQINEELAGKWFVNIKGNGAVKAFGAKDLFIKTWIRKPVPDSIQSLNVPINIEAVITGEQKDKLYVEAQIKKNGVYEAFPVILKNNNGIYQGVYDKPGQTGTYDIEIRVFQGDQPVTGASSRVYVKAIPSVETDFYNNEKSFLTGKEIIVTSWLNLNDNLLKPNADLVIKSYQIKFNYIDGKEETTNLYDDGNPKNGDILTKDGIYSCKIKFTGIGMMKSSLITKGTYKGESFLLEKNLGKYQVYSPGALSIKQDSDQLYGKKGDTIEIPLLIKNTSAFLETINLSTDSSFGSFPVKQISAEPGEITETTVPFKLNKNLNEGVLEIPVMFTVGEPLTELTTKNINLKVEVVSGFGWIINKVFELLYILIPILLIPFVLVLTGLLLYRILVYPKTIVHGSLRFYESGNSANNKNLKLNSFRRPTVVISLNGDKKNVKIGDVKAWSGRFNYNLILTVIYEKGRWKFVEGYKALLKNGKTAKLMLRATEPGIFLYNGKGYTEKELFHGDIFETGGYLFQYLERNKPVEHEYGKDLLEGKI
jgi:hypothetical protein